ncbi:MAG: hypothetical protein AAB506_00895 [Patescibacteria group bacterium]
MVPKNLQGVLWSVDTKKLDREKNKIYIINQILAYGTWGHLRWLFKTYNRAEIIEVFRHYPDKDYTTAAFNFVKNILLGLENTYLDIRYYDRSLPRYIGH